MRILHVDSGRSMRGGQWQVLYLLQGLRERGHELRLLARGLLLERARAEGFDAVSRVWRVRGWADVVHAHDASSHTMAALWGIRGRPALVVSRRVAFPVRTGFLSRWKYSRPDHFIAISQCVASQLSAAGIEPERISVVYDGVPLISDAGTRKGGLVVAVATMDPMKGTDLLQGAACASNTPILLSDDLPRDLPRASVFVYVTRSEGLGSAVLLAMANGVPVVASRIGGLLEIVRHGESGLLVDNTPDAIGQAIRTLLGDRELRERMSQAARRIGQQFSLASMVQGTVRVYEKVQE